MVGVPFRTATSRSANAPHKSDERTNALRVELANAFAKPLVTAADKFRIDLDNKDERLWLLLWLAWAAYHKRDGGRPEKWSPVRLEELLGDVQNLMSDTPGLSEAEACNRLSRKSNHPNYYPMNPGTLRRKLQDAKRLGSANRLVDAIR